MKLEDQVVGLELAKKLKELGVKQESYCYWREGNKEDPTYRIVTMVCAKGGTYSAFTVAELGEMLPNTFRGNVNNLIHTKYKDGYSSSYYWNNFKVFLKW